MNARSWLLSLLIVAPIFGEDKLRLVRETEARTPEQERAALHVPAGFEVQLFVSEPMINKPINMAFDARGRLWVSSTVEYPYSADKSRWTDPQGTRVKDSRDAIKVLEDTDGDGRADKVTDFADGLNIPTGVVPWHKPEHKSGCIAWSIPNIWYFADTDGDDKADLREILFGPLGYEKDTHGMCSSFRIGLDGWIYATHGFNNTSKLQVLPQHRQPGTENSEPRTLELHSGNVFRFRPDGSRIEPWTHGQVNPFGLCWDRYGNLYSADCHSSPIYQLIRGAHYPSFGKPHDGLGFAPVMCQHTHGSTGICGIVYIDGGVWGPEWDDHMFVGNCVTSKVNHDKVTFTGSTPKANEQPDFITSDDPWFRPVDLQLGPDNALYIADFYNRIIGHYEVQLDHPGRDKERGRIWRVVKKGHTLSLSDITPIIEPVPSELEDDNIRHRSLAIQVIKIARPNEPFWSSSNEYSTGIMRLNWWNFDILRRQRQTLLNGHRWDKTLADPKSAIPEVEVVEALHQAQEFGFRFKVDPGVSFFGDAGVRLALLHASPRVRQAALVATQAHPSLALVGDVIECLLNCPDNDPVLRLTARLALREHLVLSGAFAMLPPEQKSLAEGIAIAVPNSESAAFMLRRLEDGSPISKDTLVHIARFIEVTQLPKVIHFAKTHQPDSVESLQAIHDGLSERGAPANAELLTWAQELALKLLASLDQKATPAWTSLAPASSEPKWSLQSRQCSDGREAKVLQSMVKGGEEEKLTGILRSKDFSAPTKLVLWINGHRGLPTAKAHDKNLVRIVDAKDSAVLASAFPPRNDVCQRVELDLAKHVGKAVRLEIVDGDDGKAYAWLGITRIEPAVISVDDFETEDSHRASLKTLAAMLQHTAPAALREKLDAFMPPRPAPPPLPISPEQRKQLNALIAARSSAFAKARPDAGKGKQLFLTNCAACHRIGGEGGLVGPQLDGIGNRGADRLCEDILDPNRNVDAHFHIHTLTLKDGTSMSGFLKGEAGQVIILADAAGQEHRVGKTEVVKDDPTPMSLMPPVFGQTIPEKDFADLLGWLLTK